MKFSVGDALKAATAVLQSSRGIVIAIPYSIVTDSTTFFRHALNPSITAERREKEGRAKWASKIETKKLGTNTKLQPQPEMRDEKPLARIGIIK
ncbi:hypothetical protein KFK09_008428 [Dendrobium nobile]|uniref:Uncharacterized protein n=1 Tax=Dendrobium nobile TaxID=94219 RepID=A0A8T3BKN8_DENNO|nr:hypothetical protein KFK09_008428 [Dendrobium nobile]